MAVRIRLTRVGATKRPSYRVIAIDKRRARDGRALEILGFYDPLTDPATVKLDAERITEWIGKGAQPSETVVKLMRQAGIGGAAPAAATPAKASATKTTKAAKSTRGTGSAKAAKATKAGKAEKGPADEGTAESPADEGAAGAGDGATSKT